MDACTHVFVERQREREREGEREIERDATYYFLPKPSTQSLECQKQIQRQCNKTTPRSMRIVLLVFHKRITERFVCFRRTHACSFDRTDKHICSHNWGRLICSQHLWNQYKIHMYIYMHMYIRIQYIYIILHLVNIKVTYTYIHMCTYIYIYIFTRIHIYTYIHVSIHVYVYKCRHTGDSFVLSLSLALSICTYDRIQFCTYNTHICIYVYI